MNDPHKTGVIGFYDTHPINEDEILAKLAARGDDLSALTELQSLNLTNCDKITQPAIDRLKAGNAKLDVEK